MTEPVYSSGRHHSTFAIGSSRRNRPSAELREGGARRDFERQHRRVDVVERAVDQRRLDVDHGKPASTPEP